MKDGDSFCFLSHNLIAILVNFYIFVYLGMLISVSCLNIYSLGVGVSLLEYRGECAEGYVLWLAYGYLVEGAQRIVLPF